MFITLKEEEGGQRVSALKADI
ncbi:rCG33050 [Rattus norvegicus]|uniref:RCG33050 n=1 Tax=Rattus norvegicus TaxID=10116 RepID=A6HFF7_RAT|nr:rCG33050 [Rattus norvegicus]